VEIQWQLYFTSNHDVDRSARTADRLLRPARLQAKTPDRKKT
jgi:hypothetical protein